MLSIGTRAPDWVRRGFDDYARRMPRECRLELKTLAVEKVRGRDDVRRRREQEGRRLLKAVPEGVALGALDIGGDLWTTEQLSGHLEHWLGSGRDVALLVGGRDGLSSACRDAALFRWSLSPLTFPHALVRVLVAEQIFRAWGILHNHPYHRA